jgi:thiopeptide-type bacteriocin biosynthesis protein
VLSALDGARRPIVFSLLAEKVAADFPEAARGRVTGMLAELLRQGALLSSLHAPSSSTDALTHLLDELDVVDAAHIEAVAGTVRELRRLRQCLDEHNAAESGRGRALRAGLRHQMTRVADDPHPLAVDLRLDCTLRLPRGVAREAEKAATVLAALAPPGPSGWRDFHNRFFARYGVGVLVPVKDVVDPNVGIGLPAGFLDAVPEPRQPAPRRDLLLAALAQQAALEGRDEIVIDEELLDRLRSDGERGDRPAPPHLEVTFQVSAPTLEAVRRGEFTVRAVQPSRGVGTYTGRFLHLLEERDQAAMAAMLRELPSVTADALRVQLSFPPLDRGDAHVTRVPLVLPAVLPVSEHKPVGVQVVDLDDLALGCDGQRLYLASLSLRRPVESQVLHALDMRAHTAPLVRFLAEIARSQCAAVTAFPWGSAGALPFLPRVRYGRAVLAEARWRLSVTDLPGPQAAWRDWHAAVDAWRARSRVPRHAALTEGDQLLPLDLEESSHRAVLRAHLAVSDTAVLTESATDRGWFGGRAHEITVPLAVRTPPRPSATPSIRSWPRLGRDGHGDLPGQGRWVLAKLYAAPERHEETVARHLPDLLARWPEPPSWWIMRLADPRPHLRLRVEHHGHRMNAASVMTAISDWVTGLRRLGLCGDVEYAAHYAETGRWGAGRLLELAEDVFVADSRTLAVQWRQRRRPDALVLSAVNAVSLAGAFFGTDAGMRWLAEQTLSSGEPALDRALLGEVVRLADPAGNWAALRAAPGGEAIAEAWVDRDRAVARYRAAVDEEDMGPDLPATSLLHAHHLRAACLDKSGEQTSMRLARAAARAWLARRGNHETA